MSDYAFTCTAQMWRVDPYYVASSRPHYKVTVIAATKDQAVAEVLRIMGDPDRDYYWRIRVFEVTDARLVRREDAEEVDG